MCIENTMLVLFGLEQNYFFYLIFDFRFQPIGYVNVYAIYANIYLFSISIILLQSFILLSRFNTIKSLHDLLLLPVFYFFIE
jgi:hypothetical protein